jgi:integrase
VIGLNDEAFAIVQRLALKHPTGPLFRSGEARPLGKHKVAARLTRLSEKPGFPLHAYIFRRTYATGALANGLTADVLKAARSNECETRFSIDMIDNRPAPQPCRGVS